MWGEGEWANEPDLAHFSYKEYECRIKRNWGGSLCGYVKIPSTHPFYGKDYDDIPVEVHGGLTYAEQETNDFWIGFDCAHAGDLCPLLSDRLKKILKKYKTEVTYKNWAYVENEIENLVEQLIENETPPTT